MTGDIDENVLTSGVKFGMTTTAWI